VKENESQPPQRNAWFMVLDGDCSVLVMESKSRRTVLPAHEAPRVLGQVLTSKRTPPQIGPLISIAQI